MNTPNARGCQIHLVDLVLIEICPHRTLIEQIQVFAAESQDILIT